MARYFLTLSYDGAAFNGWQIQENTASTVQQVLQEKMSMILKEAIELTGCGRTDTGVHAKHYVAHFESSCADIISNKKHWLYKFNTVLPQSISVEDIRPVRDDAHARFTAQSRTYFYFIHQHKNPFIERYSLYVHGEIDFDLMNKAAETLLEYQDFTSFAKLHTQNKTNNCKITKAKWQKVAEHEWRFTITADRFLRGMIRAVVGTLLLVGRNKITIDQFRKIIEARDRNIAGSNVSPHALFLTGIKYPSEIYID